MKVSEFIVRNNYNYRYLLILVAIYISCFPLIQIGFHKPLTIGYLHLTSGALIFTFSMCLTDIVTEVYGFQVGRQLIWSHVPATLFYLSSLFLIVNLNAPESWSHQADYDYIFRGTGLIGLLGNAGIIIGYMTNVIILSKWKILVQGRYFWLRSIAASIIGDIIQLILGMLGALNIDIFSYREWVHVCISIVVLRIIMAGILSLPANLVVNLLKELEGVDIYDNNVDYNPFKLSIN